MSNVERIDSRQAQAFLANSFATEISKVELIGEGAWSRCFGFRRGEEELAIRFGKHVEDFQKDQLAHAYTTPELPVPKVLAIGRAFGGYYAVSSRVRGVPLESLSPSEWHAIVPQVVSALEAMRLTDLSCAEGFGSWASNGSAPHDSWSSHLLQVGNDTPDQRTHGWRQRLTASAQAQEAFNWGFDLLKRVAHDSIPRSLVHCDLINRNVLVNDGRITGIFDWGCSRYGDHLYDLAWFEFWAPWLPKLAIHELRSAIEQRWRAVGYAPEHKEQRLMACYLHIGLDHLAYNAYLDDWPTLMATAERMRTLVTAI